MIGYAILDQAYIRARNLDEQLQEAMPVDSAPPSEPKAADASGAESASANASKASAAAATTPVWLSEPMSCGRKVSFEPAHYDYEWHGSAKQDPMLKNFDSSNVNAAPLIEGNVRALALLNG